MRKKLDTRFPAARIKKIMQADEDVGKIAMAVPLLVSKALELFLQDLCDRTYEITLQRGAKTMSSVHLKQCVQNFNVFDFLRETVSRVPDLGGSHGGGDDKSATKRRKVVANEEHHLGDEESKGSRMHGALQISRGGKGRGRGRGRGRGCRRDGCTNDVADQHDKFEDGLEMHHERHGEQPVPRLDNEAGLVESKESTLTNGNAGVSVRNFDLNIGLDENVDSTSIPVISPTRSSVKSDTEVLQEVYPGWSLHEMESMSIDPTQLTTLNHQMVAEDEDYDAEDYDEEE